MAKTPYGADGDPEGTPRGMEPFVLLRLAEGPAHGYELAQAISALGFRRAADDRSVLYRLLRVLEADGFTASSWTAGDGGPPRRVYALTARGLDYLHARAGDLARQAQRIAAFLAGYQSWSARAGARRRSSRTRARGRGARA